MSELILPKDYKPALDVETTEKAIKKIKDYFQVAIADELLLRRVTAPIIVLRGTGINDDLNGIERPVSFPIKGMDEQKAEVVHSLAKWKRLKLADLKLETGRGIYTDMNALRPDEELGSLHSIYVDQWDWEKTIDQKDRTIDYLKETVEKIFNVYKRTEEHLTKEYPEIKQTLPSKITFVYAEDLLREYPELTVKQRETEAAKKYGAVFIIGIGGKLSNGEPHDGRAPDYDDWTTETKEGYYGLNGDIVFWNPTIERAFEVSSMGIRVDKKALLKQLEISGEESRKEFLFHKLLLNDQLPYTIGGGIGQSRTCMYLLQKAHVGEVQASIWPKSMKEICSYSGIKLL
ncbi:aspartate--ammonia ligase [Vicingus serpentipes]|uniref:Aspartate--ammonia ligase n=1 Tax=Vicingus serpentipes TaxID=1926625 RepID=A0A5C6RXJ8_9FLAO|nr:aspartate--ammonia ligase [Vicingus serpentipes]TXB66893.1 aspartate--ammonia ligase [Vicingus serpentipes]